MAGSFRRLSTCSEGPTAEVRAPLLAQERGRNVRSVETPDKPYSLG
jgi:hypothetical protein